ncbi:MAG: hypothetical protein ACK40G_16695 [Cytophagaceae bacterium]
MKRYAVLCAILLLQYNHLSFGKQPQSDFLIHRPVDLPKGCKPQKTLRDEVLEIEKVSINEQIPFQVSTSDLTTKIGEPVNTGICESKGLFNKSKSKLEDNVYSWRYPGLEFLVYRDIANIRIIQFKNSDLRLVHPEITLSADTTLEQLREVFPISCKNGYDMKDEETGKNFHIVRLNTKLDWVDEWVLKFDNERLSEIEFWTP